MAIKVAANSLYTKGENGEKIPVPAFGAVLSDEDRSTLDGISKKYELLIDTTTTEDADEFIYQSDGLSAVTVMFEYAGTVSGSIGTLFISNNNNISYAFRPFTSANKYAFATCEKRNGRWNGLFTSPTSLYATPSVLMDAPDALRRGMLDAEMPSITKVRIYKNSNGGAQVAAGSRIVIWGVKA